MLPLILFIDIDGTLVGDVKPQVCEWEILDKHDPSKLASFKQHLIDVLKCGLLRPNIADFLTSLKDSYEHVEFFIFTAADKDWATFLVPCIEKVIGLKFNRPVFTRKHCSIKSQEYKKSLDAVLPWVIRNHKRKYPTMSLKTLRNRVAIIDNNNVLVSGETHRCIDCPTYTFMYFHDVLSRLPIETLQRKYHDIAATLIKYGMIVSSSSLHYNTMSFNTFRTMYYKRLAELIAENAKYCKQGKDDYWVKLMNVMKNLSLENLRDNTIKCINKQMHRTKKAI
jgi:hypothetical protein